MKVAVLIDAWLPFLGGSQKAVLEVSKILKKEKKTQSVIFHSFSSIIFFRSLWMLYVIPHVIFYHLFIQRFDLIDARAYSAGFPGKALSSVLGIPIVYTVNGCGNLDQKKKGFLSWLERILLTKIKYNQQISDSQHFLKYKNVNKKVLIIPNGVDIRKFKKVKVRKNKVFTLVYVGRLAKVKGLIYLLKAVEKLVKKKKDFYLKIIGTGKEKDNLKEYVKKNNLSRWVRFLGEIKGEKLLKEYKSSHLFVLPSLAEGQPITLLEAWAASLPVIASSVGSLPYFINSQNGFLVPSKNPDKLYRVILKAIRKKNLKEMGSNGFKLVSQKYSWHKAADSYLQVYEKLVN